MSQKDELLVSGWLLIIRGSLTRKLISDLTEYANTRECMFNILLLMSPCICFEADLEFEMSYPIDFVRSLSLELSENLQRMLNELRNEGTCNGRAS